MAVITETLASNKGHQRQIDIVLRDIQKAFDKVWIVGLQHKILNLHLPPALERILCDYLTDRQAVININDHTGNPFALKAGVPQGGCLSPTLFIIYTADVPTPRHNLSLNIYADDITQIVPNPSKSHRTTAARTSSEINIINRHEKTWKIKTNTTKTKVIPIGRRKTGDIILDNGDIMYYDQEGVILGLKISTTGYKTHVTNRVNKAKAELTKLFRFRELSTRNKRKLYLSLIRPILTYPTIPMCRIPKYQMSKLQRSRTEL